MAQLEVREPTDVGSRNWPETVLRALFRRALLARQARRNRLIVASLDDAQLQDAGIDRTVAGRGKAVAVDPLAALTLRAMGDHR